MVGYRWVLSQQIRKSHNLQMNSGNTSDLNAFGLNAVVILGQFIHT